MSLWKLINNIFMDHPKTFIARFLSLDAALPMARPIIKPTTKQKHGKDKPAKFTQQV